MQSILLAIDSAGVAQDKGNARQSRDRAEETEFDWSVPSESQHLVQFYDTEDFLLDAVSDFICSGLELGDPALVVATEAHRTALNQRLRSRGLNGDAERAAGKYLTLDADQTLRQFMRDGAPNLESFREVFAGTIARTAQDGHQVRIFGEMVALLAAAGNTAGAVRLEELWNRLQEQIPCFVLFCAYPMDSMGEEALGEVFSQICAHHSSVIPAESYSRRPTMDERLREVAALQQKAQWLETEMLRRREAEEQLRASLEAERSAREVAEAASQMRDEFLSVAAHELKTPITSLMGYSQLLLRSIARGQDTDPKRLTEVLQVLAGQSEKLARLVSELLDVSRLQSGRLTLKRELTDLAELARRCVSTAQTWSERHGIVLQAPSSLLAEIDGLRMEQMLNNLLNNAIKYSPDGGEIEVTLTSSGPSEALLRVRDHGLGIPPEKREQIFERFYQAHDDLSRSGMGLGLYICRQIAELHGGRLRADFPADGGSCFSVLFPALNAGPLGPEAGVVA